jgi:hypothetical protein
VDQLEGPPWRFFFPTHTQAGISPKNTALPIPGPVPLGSWPWRCCELLAMALSRSPTTPGGKEGKGPAIPHRLRP